MLEGYETYLTPAFFSYQPYVRWYGFPETSPYPHRLRDDQPYDPMQDEPDAIPTAWKHDIDLDFAEDFVMSTPWTIGTLVTVALGQVVGLAIAPRLSRWLGYRISSLLSLTLTAALLAIPLRSAFMNDATDTRKMKKNAIILVSETLLGIPWGLFQGLSMPHLTDILPLKLKSPFTTFLNAFWLFGQMTCAAVLRLSLVLGRGDYKTNSPQLILQDPWAFRVPMCAQFIWIIPLALLFLKAPESPHHLMRNDNDEKALDTLQRLSRDPHYDAKGNLEAMHMLNEREKAESADMGFLACFSKEHRRRTEVAIVINLSQQLVGAPMIGFTTGAFHAAGLSQSMALTFSIMTCFLAILGCFCSIPILRTCRRRASWLSGVGASLVCLLTIAVGGFIPRNASMIMPFITGWAAICSIILFNIVYNTTIAPIGFAIVSEIPATRLKAATASLGRAAYLIAAVINLIFTPFMFTPKPIGWGLGCKSALAWIPFCAVCFLWAWWRLPETKDLSPAEVDIMFEEGCHIEVMKLPRFLKFGPFSKRQTDEEPGETEKVQEAEASGLGSL